MDAFAVRTSADLKLKESLYGVFRRGKGTVSLRCILVRRRALPVDIIIDYGEEKSVIGGMSVSLGARQDAGGGTEYYAAFSNGDTNVVLLSSGLS